jgi:hypothetical protein
MSSSPQDGGVESGALSTDDGGAVGASRAGRRRRRDFDRGDACTTRRLRTDRITKRTLLIALSAALALVAAGCIPPLAPQAGDAVDFWYRGSPYSYTVPAGVCSVTVDAYGAAGGNGANGDPDLRGFGAQVQGTVKVTPGEVLQVNPGGPGGDGEATTTQLAHGGSGGWNGGAAGGDATPSSASGPWSAFAGGGGGGASDVRQGGTDLANRVVVAGGGGGTGAQANNDLGWGGDGGDPDGGDGSPFPPSPTFATGGAGGQLGGPGFPGTPGGTWGGYGGGAGATASGGGVPNSAMAGGGGGAGYFGGGGGGFSGVGPAGGGGGGASYTAPSVTHVFMDWGVAEGVGKVTLTPRKCT